MKKQNVDIAIAIDQTRAEIELKKLGFNHEIDKDTQQQATEILSNRFFDLFNLDSEKGDVLKVRIRRSV